MKTKICMLFVRIKELIDVIIWGIPTTIVLLLKNQNTVYYIPHVGIGDYYAAMGYLSAYKSHYGIRHITLIATAGRKEFCSFYSDYDEILILPKHQYLGLVFLGSVPVLRSIHLMCKRIENVSYTLYMGKSLLYKNPGLHVKECTKIILKIPKDSKFVLPSIPETNISALVKKYVLPECGTVILNPFTSGLGIQELDKRFYEELVRKLKKKNFRVVTILGNTSQKPIAETDGVVTSLAEAYYLANWCGWVVGTRSGFFDFIQFAECQIITIYEAGYRQQEFFCLGNSENGYKIHELFYENDYKYMSDMIVSQIMRSKVSKS